jgi:hypothetical protein
MVSRYGSGWKDANFFFIGSEPPAVLSKIMHLDVF